MPVYHGNKKIKSIFVHSKIGALYKGSTLVFSNLIPMRFDSSDNLQEYLIPLYVKSLLVDCVASSGNGNIKGGRVTCKVHVDNIRKLYINVGKARTSDTDTSNNSSDIRTDTDLNSRVVVAGGGGNSGWGGGLGGGLIGGNGPRDIIAGGLGGTQTAGGAHSFNVRGTIRSAYWGNDGTFGKGGTGPYTGGDGWYGGGSGGTADVKKVGVLYVGGGGGSSYTKPDICTNVQHYQGVHDGNGYIIITPLV